MSIEIQSPSDILAKIASKARDLRLAENLTRRTLAEKSGISESSIKRFETTGEISLHGLVNIAFAFGRSREFNALFNPKTPQSLDELQAPLRKRGRK